MGTLCPDVLRRAAGAHDTAITVYASIDEAVTGLTGCDRIFTDTASGALAQRPQLDAALAYVREGDRLVVWRLDRLRRSLKHLLQVVGDLGDRGVEFHSLTEALDTSTPTGRLLFSVVGAVGEFERDFIRERTHAGLAAARARGRKGGRKPLMTPTKIALAQRMYTEGTPPTEIANALAVSRATIYRHVRANEGLASRGE